MCSFLRYTMIRSSWTYLIFLLSLKQLRSNTLYFWCLPECLFIQRLFLPLLRTNSLLMLQSSPFKVNITSKMPTFIGFMKSTCIFGHSKEKMDHHASLNHQEYCQYQKYLLKLSGDYKLSKSSIFRVQAFWRHCGILKVQIIFRPDQK